MGYLHSYQTILGLSVIALATACGSSDDSNTPATPSTGGKASAGSSATGGASGGASATGGTRTGGAATGGSMRITGGTATGGQPTGGSATGGTATGGQSTGGTVTGGQSTGGSATGGQSTGGAIAGGTSSTGGATTTGGTSSTGGARTGGSTATGGASATGGATNTGGATTAGGTSSTGGASTGGSTSEGGTSSTGGETGAGGTTPTNFCAADTSGITKFCRPAANPIALTQPVTLADIFTFTPNGTSITLTSEDWVSSYSSIPAGSPFIGTTCAGAGIDARVAGSDPPVPYTGVNLTIRNSGSDQLVLLVVVDDRSTGGQFVERTYELALLPADDTDHSYTLTWNSDHTDSCDLPAGSSFDPTHILGVGLGISLYTTATRLNLTFSNISFIAN